MPKKNIDKRTAMLIKAIRLCDQAIRNIREARLRIAYL
jgi:hypothetical protein